MKLLFLDQFSDLGGAQQVLLEFLPTIKERGWSALIGLPGEGELFRKVRDLGFETARITCGPYQSGVKSLGDMARFASGTPVLARQIRQLANDFGADVIYINGPRILPAAALLRPATPVVFHCHSYLSPGAMRQLAGRSLRACDAWLIGSCRFVSEPLKPYVVPGKQLLIYNGVAGPRVPQRRATEFPTIACIGRIAPEKGQREFVAVAATIRRTWPQWRFVVYGAALFGDRTAAQYDAEVREAGAREGVQFAGWTPDVYAALAGTDLLLVPSADHEATTRVILEAQAAGVPAIAFRSGGIPEVIGHGVDGWLANTTGEMAKIAVEVLSRDAESLRAISCAARASWERRFTMQRFHQELCSALERIASRKGD